MIIQPAIQTKEHSWGTTLRRLVRLSAALAAAVLLFGVAAPYVNAGAFRNSIQASLQEALGRKVDIDAVHFNLFSGPGFTLENVTIEEGPGYGLEPFAYASTLQLRIRLDKLLLGQIRPLSIKLVDASLNLVKSEDGSWNAVRLIERLGAPRHSPFNFFPAVQIENGRVDFKLGVRKTSFYLTETDLSIYPEQSGKIYFKFEGSPARTDRAGIGFGHLAGTANWYLQPAANGHQLEADVDLQPSNLSELTTLFQGHDLGVHGALSGHVRIGGPFTNLQALGDLRLEDVHRWDLLPSPGDSWRVRFAAKIDLAAHSLELSTLAPAAGSTPVALQFRTHDFMTHPSWSVLASLRKAPLASLLPLGKRMGMALPQGLSMDGTLDGVIGISNAAGVEGGLVITNAVANVPDVPPLRSASASITISDNNIHIEPAILQSNTGGTLRAGGNFNLLTQNLTAEISAEEFSVDAFKETTNAWFSSPGTPGSPAALASIRGGNLSGRLLVNLPGGDPAAQPVWSGQFQFQDANVIIPGSSVPARKVQGKATFDKLTFDLPRFTGFLGDSPISGAYHYNAAAKRPEHLHLDLAHADLADLEAWLAPALNDNTLLSRLPFTRRHIAAWLARRSADGDFTIGRLSLGPNNLGSFAAHFLWQGTSVQLTNVQLDLPTGQFRGAGSVSLNARLPRYRFAGKLDGFPWYGGALSAGGSIESFGAGALLLQNITAHGAFAAQDVAFPGADAFTLVAGQFDSASDGDAPILKLTKVEARQNGEDLASQTWSGEGASTADGTLHLELTNGERQLHLFANILPGKQEAGIFPPALR